MGYYTDFSGKFNLNKPLAENHAAYLRKFSETRRMKRDVSILGNMPDPVRESVGLSVGYDGGYFVGGSGYAGQERDASILEYNHPPAGQPGLWCQWVPNGDGSAIVWDDGEKFYDYVEWIEYLVEHFLKPWGYVLNGKVKWYGESDNDRGLIEIIDNVVKTKIGTVV